MSQIVPGASPGPSTGLELRGVTHHYGHHLALDDVSVAVAPGEVVCLLGPSGCGKTTLLRLAAGLERVQAGEVRIAGRVVANLRSTVPPEARSAGMVFQDFALFPHLSVAENVAFGLARVPRAERRPRALAALERVGLAARAGAFPHALSGGEQQRVALARALAPRPAVMLLDEPFAGLDTRLRRQIREESVAILRESGAAVLLVTHDPDEASALGDRVAVMRAGRLEQDGPPAELYARPRNPFVALFLGDANRLPGELRDGVVRTRVGELPLELSDLSELPTGAAIEVFVRPEAVRLAPLASPQPLMATPHIAMPATVERVRKVGPQCHVDVRVTHGGGATRNAEHGDNASQLLRALTLGSTDLREGDVVELSIDPAGVRCFPLTADPPRP